VDPAGTSAEIKAADKPVATKVDSVAALVETKAAQAKAATRVDLVETNPPVVSLSQLMTLGTLPHQLVDSAEMTNPRSKLLSANNQHST